LLREAVSDAAAAPACIAEVEVQLIVRAGLTEEELPTSIHLQMALDTRDPCPCTFHLAASPVQGHMQPCRTLGTSMYT
jgi:hypothetical protein